jgi:hypothetical protein
MDRNVRLDVPRTISRWSTLTHRPATRRGRLYDSRHHCPGQRTVHAQRDSSPIYFFSVAEKSSKNQAKERAVTRLNKAVGQAADSPTR